MERKAEFEAQRKQLEDRYNQWQQERAILIQQRDLLRNQAMSLQNVPPQPNQTRAMRLAQSQQLKSELIQLQQENERLHFEVLNAREKLIGTIKVQVNEARNLKAKIQHGNRMNPYCTVQLETQTHQTRTLSKTIAPRWDQTFTMFISNENANLEITVWDEVLKMGKPGFRGRCIVPLANLPRNTPVTGWHKLISRHPGKEKDYGDLNLTLVYLKS
eukprot:TRINITY_DN1845_c0_g2_i1.p1 TRINITY_DN1845_c0_g2~~TRINITY_DN1845_c0_g2_i1.p1  ORF type:complete len:216 (-),score=37.87 TRINITY_DN1845_c0_g2_i1:17-664(-)